MPKNIGISKILGQLNISENIDISKTIREISKNLIIWLILGHRNHLKILGHSDLLGNIGISKLFN